MFFNKRYQNPDQNNKKEYLNRPFRLILFISVPILLSFFLWSANQARQTASNQILDWLPNGTKEAEIFFNHYYAYFPEGELLMISWKGCHLKDQRLDLVAEKLSSFPPGQRPYYDRIVTTRSVLEELQDEPLQLSKKEALFRLRGWLIGRNGSDACLVAMISSAGVDNRHAVIEQTFRTVEEVTGHSRNDIYIAGPTIDSVAIDDISMSSQQSILPFFLLFCFILLLFCLRNFLAAAVVFLVALMNEELGPALLFWTGTHMDSISLLIGSLVYVLTISAGVHLANYYRETLQNTPPLYAPQTTVKKAFLPCMLAVITTVLGIGSLAISQMIPIRQFGIFASFTLIIGTVYLFLLLPAVFQEDANRRRNRNGREQKIINTLKWEWWGNIVCRYSFPLTVFFITLMIVLGYGLSRLNTSVTFHGMFYQNAKVIRDYDQLEMKIGGLIPIEVVLRIPETGNKELSLLNQLYFVETVKNSLVQTEHVDAVISALNFLPILPQRKSGSMRDTSQRSAIASMLKRHIASMKATRFFNQTEGRDAATYWRFSLRIPANSPIHYGQLLQKLRERLQTVNDSPMAATVYDYHFDVTGGVPLVHQAQAQLLKDLVNSFFMAFGLIAVTMILMLGGIVRGLIAMIPNIFPCVIVFGAMGWLGHSVDMGSMMTASVAMGIAIDGTLHFMTWFYDGLKQGQNRATAIIHAYQQCATALCQTTIICGFGMLVFGISEFVPVAQFAILLCFLLLVALIGDIIVMPAILFSFLGRVYESKKNST
jgi:predicted RND superfamily exporter protein